MTEKAPDADRSTAPLDGTIIACLKATAALGLVFAIGGVAVDGVRTGIGVAAGGTLATANLWVFALVLRGMLTGGEHGRRWGMAAGLKALALFAIAWLLLSTNVTTGLTLAIGYGSLPLGITIGGLFGRNVDERARD